jgi:protein-S-isoprenylcysteine O-methyltransferase Ste14
VTTSEEDHGFLPTEPPRRRAESTFVRVVATLGIIAVGTAVAAILDGTDVAGWITGLVVSTLSVIIAAILWRSRTL